ncbi:hypothetical protein [Paludibaculum fermentans]|uniref:hypothetical protein n=1 Tax=Paludibaculum fermentans TaxID=1473598 RepID=UPI003EBE9E5F
MTVSGPDRSIAPPPRLSVLLAAQAPVGIVFRRGPSRTVRVIHWDRTQDVFTPGATFRGRIYTDRSDISPDGRHMIYFAMGGAAWAIAGAGYTWTAISEAPSVTALSLWGPGDTWGGGGYFLSNDSYWLESDGNTSLIRDNAPLRRETNIKNRTFPSALDRDGWINRSPTRWDTLYEKELIHDWLLRAAGEPRRYELEQRGRAPQPCPNWEWAGWDRNRLVWAESGCLRAASLEPEGLSITSTLIDFSTTPAPNTAADSTSSRAES